MPKENNEERDADTQTGNIGLTEYGEFYNDF
jgi:hypothetical protein